MSADHVHQVGERIVDRHGIDEELQGTVIVLLPERDRYLCCTDDGEEWETSAGSMVHKRHASSEELEAVLRLRDERTRRLLASAPAGQRDQLARDFRVLMVTVQRMGDGSDSHEMRAMINGRPVATSSGWRTRRAAFDAGARAVVEADDQIDEVTR